MFGANSGVKIAGYTGHQQSREVQDSAPGNRVGVKHIPGKSKINSAVLYDASDDLLS